MLKTRILTALVLVPLVLAALFLLPPRGWALLTLVIIALAASEWARLAGFSRPGSLTFAAVTALSAATLLLVPMTRFNLGWPEPVILTVCGAAALFWVVIAPICLAVGIGPRAKGSLA